MARTNIAKLLTNKRKIIDKTIEDYLPRRITKKYMEFLVGQSSGYNPAVLKATLSDPIWNFFDRGGKRLRPVLFWLLLESLGGNLRKAKDFLIIPELIHAGSLCIDDVEDSSELRRGERCLHHLFGIDIALNAGNMMYFLPLKSFMKRKSSFPPQVFQKAYEAYIQEMINLGIGQAIDIGWHRDIALPRSEQEYYEMCKQKTGSMMRLSVKLAAIFSGVPDRIIKKLAEIAEKTAVAFQIQDDVLDIDLQGASRAKFGKSFGNDIKEGKKTLMVIYVLRRGSERDKKKLLKILNKHTGNYNEASQAIAIIKKYGALDYAKEKARIMIQEVQADLDKLLKGKRNHAKIQDLMEFLIQRSY